MWLSKNYQNLGRTDHQVAGGHSRSGASGHVEGRARCAPDPAERPCASTGGALKDFQDLAAREGNQETCGLFQVIFHIFSIFPSG